MEIISFIGFVLACQAIGLLGSIPTFKAIPTWYARLTKPSWTPPNKVFGPVWTALYLLMALAAWRCYDVEGQRFEQWLTPFAVQLGLNLAWSWIFFGAKKIGLALIEMVVLWAFILWCLIAFWKVDELSGILLMPYLLWVSFAFSLNAGIWILNRKKH
ncbi:MAG TPA: TspO/MBR family protein [Fimbriimonadaceae bacterium]